MATPPTVASADISRLITQIREKAAERSTISTVEKNGMLAFNALVDLAFQEYQDQSELTLFLQAIYGIIGGERFPEIPNELQNAFKNGIQKLTESHPEKMLGTAGMSSRNCSKIVKQESGPAPSSDRDPDPDNESN